MTGNARAAPSAVVVLLGRAGGVDSTLRINALIVDATRERPGAGFPADLRAQGRQERRRVERLRGRRLNEYTDGGFLVMADPEGNEFCVIPEGPFELDDEGRADYLS
ncbi:VOC family protein [Actinocorallia cavernae]|uniref:VOC family protein n=1 Tax=Actinocorallia cavernae TaxID=328075 RepID=UPI0031F99E91